MSRLAGPERHDAMQVFEPSGGDMTQDSKQGDPGLGEGWSL